MTTDFRHLSGILLAAAGAMLFSLKGVVMKLAFGLGANVEQMMALRMGISLPIFLLVGFLFVKRNKLAITHRAIIFASGLGVLSYYICTWLDFTGLRFISTQLERLILFLYPTIVAVLAFIAFGDKITWRHAVALVLSYSGVALLAFQEFNTLGPNAALGAALVFLAAVLFAFYVTASKPVIAQLGSALFTSIAMGAAAIAILIHFAVMSTHATMTPLTPSIIGLGLFLAILCTVAPSFMISEAIARVGPGLSSATGGLGPAATVVAAVLVIGEPFGFAQAAALILTVGGVMLLMRSSN